MEGELKLLADQVRSTEYIIVHSTLEMYMTGMYHTA